MILSIYLFFSTLISDLNNIFYKIAILSIRAIFKIIWWSEILFIHKLLDITNTKIIIWIKDLISNVLVCFLFKIVYYLLFLIRLLSNLVLLFLAFGRLIWVLIIIKISRRYKNPFFLAIIIFIIIFIIVLIWIILT